jgi:peptidoglycan/xylan/chitin deacetylase (PgdA/CDA1 family)
VIVIVLMAAGLVALNMLAGRGHRRSPASQSGTDRPAAGQPVIPASPSPSAPVPAAPPVSPSPAPPPGPPLPPDPTGPDGALTDTGNGNVALTFDDGPDPSYTLQVLALLRQYHVTATFCLIGENVEQYPDLVRAIVADGHTLCNHSWDHDENMASKTPDQIRADLVKTTAEIQAAAPGAVVRYYRQPGGNWSPSIVSVARDLGMSSLDWSVDPQDWTVPATAAIESTVLGQALPGSIVLMHDGGGDRSHTVEALRVMLPTLESRFQLQPMPTGAAGLTPPPTRPAV